MSKLPAKKKSCFQITSVTQAMVAAVGATDDTESLDDPEESRTEDVSSDIYDMSRAEYEPACDKGSSDEALNSAVEQEAIGVTPSNIPQLSALSNKPLTEFGKVGVSGSTQGGHQLQGIGATTGSLLITQPGAGLSVNTSEPAAVTSSAPPSATATGSCTSRFRVIKLDHGTGEPFRRGRWTCTEFYEKDSEGSVGSRTVDSIRHASATLDPAADRDSGLGHTGGSVVALTTHSGQGLGSMADASSRMHSAETLPQQQQQQQHIQHHSYSTRQQGVSGTATQSGFSSSNPTVVSVQQQAQPTAVSLQPSAPQSVLSVGQNGLPQSVGHLQKSPMMPPLAQPIAYPPQHQQQQQLPMRHQLTSQSSGLMQNQTEYYQQQPASMQPGLSTGQSLSVTSQSAVPQTVGQGPSSVMPPDSGGASVPSQVREVTGSGGGSVPTGQSAPGLLQQQTGGMGGVGRSILGMQQQTLSQHATAGHPQPFVLNLTSSGVQNVPAAAVSSSVSTTLPTAVHSASSAAMPNVTTSIMPLGQIPHSKSPGALGLQATGFGQFEGGGGRKSEGNAQSSVVSGKELVKPFMPVSLQLATPTVNSLFGIHIPVDGDEDR